MNRSYLILIDKTIVRVLFWLIVLVSKMRRRPQIDLLPKLSGNEHFLVIRPGGLGDGIMCVPLLRSLRENFPDGKITLLCVKKSKPALEHLPYYDDLLVFDDMKRLPKNLLHLWKARIDVVLDLEQFRRMTSVIAFLAGRRIRIGFDTNSRRLLYTHFVTYPNEKHFESVNMVRQLEILGIHVPYGEALDLRFPIPKEAVERGETILDSIAMNGGDIFRVAVFPGVLKPHHRWKMGEFANLIRMILEKDGNTRIVLLGTPADLPDADEVMRSLEGEERVRNLVGKTRFLESLGILRHCRVLIASDGGAVYMGASMGCQTVSLWGPGVMERFKPAGNGHIGIRKNYSCIPCVNYGRLGEFPPCPYDRRCMNDITAEDVFRRYEGMKARNV